MRVLPLKVENLLRLSLSVVVCCESIFLAIIYCCCAFCSKSKDLFSSSAIAPENTEAKCLQEPEKKKRIRDQIVQLKNELDESDDREKDLDLQIACRERTVKDLEVQSQQGTTEPEEPETEPQPATPRYGTSRQQGAPKDRGPAKLDHGPGS